MIHFKAVLCSELFGKEHLKICPGKHSEIQRLEEDLGLESLLQHEELQKFEKIKKKMYSYLS